MTDTQMPKSSGYQFEMDPAHRDPLRCPDDAWEIVVGSAATGAEKFLGLRAIDGSTFAVFAEPDGKKVAVSLVSCRR